MMQNGFICESANIETIDPAFADMPIVRERSDDAKLGCVLSNSFGFGGTNASVVFKRPGPRSEAGELPLLGRAAAVRR